MEKWEKAKSLLAIGEIVPSLEEQYRIICRKYRLTWLLVALIFIVACTIFTTIICLGLSYFHVWYMTVLVCFGVAPVIYFGAFLAAKLIEKTRWYEDEMKQVYGFILSRKYLSQQ
jgi:hypothetical protein